MMRETTMPFNELESREVEYEKSYRQFTTPFLMEGKAETNPFFVHEAQQNHILRGQQRTA